MRKYNAHLAEVLGLENLRFRKVKAMACLPYLNHTKMEVQMSGWLFYHLTRRATQRRRFAGATLPSTLLTSEPQLLKLCSAIQFQAVTINTNKTPSGKIFNCVAIVLQHLLKEASRALG